MVTRFRCGMLWVCMVALLLCGCGSDSISTLPEDSYESNLVYGSFEGDELQVLPWNSGRCEITTGYTVAETENGYYLVYKHYIYYADKENLNFWVPLCNNPECEHFGNPLCTAWTDENWVVYRDGRLYFAETRGKNGFLINSNGLGDLIVSTAPDGTDKQLAYVIEEALLQSQGSAGGRFVGGQWLYMKSEIDLNGNIKNRFFKLDTNGEKEIEIPDGSNTSLYEAIHVSFLWGDPYFESGILSGKKFLRFEGDELVGFEMKYVPETGGHISGTTLRIFKKNQGYFDIDVNTGKQTKVADNRIKNSTGFIVEPNCVIESNLFGFTAAAGREGKMEVFDGEQWREVALPEAWRNPSAEQWFQVAGVTSDSIFLYGREKSAYNGPREATELYRIPLDAEALVMEYCFTFEFPVEEDNTNE